jgi:hypothetical protein
MFLRSITKNDGYAGKNNPIGKEENSEDKKLPLKHHDTKLH